MTISAQLFAAGALTVSCSPPHWERDSDLTRVRAVARAPMTLRAMFRYAGGGYYNVPLIRMDVAAGIRRRPVAIVTPGCGFAVVASDVPRDAIILMVDEDSTMLDRPTLTEACITQDAAALEAAIADQLGFMQAKLRDVGLADPDRVVIVASGEAAPVVAKVSPSGKAKLLYGDPCFIDWPNPAQLDRRTPTTVIRGDVPTGRTQATRNPDFAYAAKDPRAAVEGLGRECDARPRTPLPSNYQVVEGHGAVSAMLRPKEGLKAAHAAFQRAVG